MTLTRARLGLVLGDQTALWTGTADGDQSASFVLAVTTTTGSLAASMRGLVLYHHASGEVARIYSVSGSNITLAENPVEFSASDELTIYNLRLPFPRYQRLDGSTIYKDYRIAFPATSEEELPPDVVIAPAVVYCAIDEQTTFDASGSIITYPGTAGSITFAWEPGTNGTVHSSTADSATISWSTAGFRYLQVTGTDPNGAVTYRYVPVWVAATTYAMLDWSQRWSLGGGWQGEGRIGQSLSHVEYSPVAIVDLESYDIKMFGFISAQNTGEDYEMTTYSFSVLSPLATASVLYGYPFVVTTVTTGTESNWSEVPSLTVERAIWYLLYWHTMLPELCNIDFGDITARSIKGQEFQGSSLAGLLNEVVAAAMYVTRGAMTGGVIVGEHPLYATSAEWAAFSVLDLTDVSRQEVLEEQHAQARSVDVRLSGVFRGTSGDYEPVIARAPAHPGNWGGATAELSNLAPISEAELQSWAERHFIIENKLSRYRAQPLVEVDPYSYELADLSTSVRIAIEELVMRYDVRGFWSADLSGRPYGGDVDSALIPIPPEVDITPPSRPTPTPVIPVLPPQAEWPTTLYAATFLKGVYYTESFSGPDEGQAIWTPVNTIDGGGTLTNCNVFHLADSGTQFVIDDNDSDSGILYRRTNGNWFNVLTAAEASVLAGYATGNLFWVDSVGSTIYVLFKSSVSGQQRMRLLKSVDDGVNWADVIEVSDGKGIFTTNSLGSAVIYSASRAIFSAAWGFAGPKGKVGFANTDIENVGYWQYSDNLGNGYYQWSCHYNPYDDIAYSNGGTGGMYKVSLLDGGLTTPGASESNLCAFVNEGWPRMAFDPDGNNEVLISGHDEPLLENRIWKTGNNWASKSTEGAVGQEIDIIYVSPYLWGNFILGRATSGDLTYPHVIFVTDDDGAILVDKGGPSPDTSPYTNSIPRDCGGICWNGIGIVE